jgi:hypothetical protein
MKLQAFLLISLFLLPCAGCDPSSSTEEGVAKRELIVFAKPGDLSKQRIEQLTKDQEAGDVLTVAELTEGGPRVIGSRVKTKKWTAKQAAMEDGDRGAISAFLSQGPSAADGELKLDLSGIVSAASEIRKTKAPLDVVVFGSPIHSQEGPFDCSGGWWMTDAVIKNVPQFSQRYEGLEDTIFWFVPPSIAWGENFAHRQGSIRFMQLLAQNSSARLGLVSNDFKAVLEHLRSRKVKLAQASMSDDEWVGFKELGSYSLEDGSQGDPTVLRVRQTQDNPRPVPPPTPNWVQQALKESQQAGRSCVAICWRCESMTEQPIDVDLWAINRQGESLFFAHPNADWGRFKRDVRASTSSQSQTVDNDTWEIIEVDGSLNDYEWFVDYYFGISDVDLKFTLVYRDSTSSQDELVEFTWSCGPADESADFSSRSTSPSWRSLQEIRD